MTRVKTLLIKDVLSCDKLNKSVGLLNKKLLIELHLKALQSVSTHMQSRPKIWSRLSPVKINNDILDVSPDENREI